MSRSVLHIAHEHLIITLGYYHWINLFELLYYLWICTLGHKGLPSIFT